MHDTPSAASVRRANSAAASAWTVALCPALMHSASAVRRPVLTLAATNMVRSTRDRGEEVVGKISCGEHDRGSESLARKFVEAFRKTQSIYRSNNR